MGKMLFFALPMIAAMAGVHASAEPVVVEGVDQYRVMEPMFEAIRVAMSQKGEDYSPAYIQGISGAAFRVAGPCPCAPTCSVAMEPQDLLKLLGYEYEHLTLFGDDIEPEKEVHNIVPRVREEIRKGNPVMVWHAFTNAEWDVVTGFDEEKKKFLGYGSYAGNNEKLAEADENRMSTCLDICPAFGAMIVGEKTGEFDAREAELAALEEAIHHANSPRDRFLDDHDVKEKPWRFREGLACYDVWQANFTGNPDRTPGAGDRYCLGWTSSTHAAAAEFLREIAPKYPEAEEHLLKAAEFFDADSKALKKLDDKVFEGWSGYKEADPEKARRTANLLKRARRNYARGIRQIEKALREIEPERIERAHQTARIQHEDGKAVIKGMKKLNWEMGWNCTFAGATTEAMRVTQHPYSYDSIMGLTGLAFRIRWSNEDTKTKWCPSAAVGEMPDEQAALSKLTGWKTPTEWIDAEGRDNESLRERIVASIDAGKPVVAYPDHWNMALIYGYEDNGKTLLFSDYMTEEFPSRVPVEELIGLFTFLGDYEEPPAMRDSLISVLNNAVKNWKRERHDGGIAGREYWYGDAAFKAWINDLEKYGEYSEEAKKSVKSLSPWIYSSLLDARKSAASFLRDWKLVVEGDSREALENAVKLYEEEIKILESLNENKPFEGDDLSKEIEVLTKAWELESKAIGEMEKALNSMEPESADKKEAKGMKKIEGLEFAPRATSHIGALEGCLKHLGVEVSPGWLFGSTGHAFILNVSDDLCGSGPHSWSWGIVNKLGQNIGYKAEAVYTNVNKDDFSQMQENAWDFARKSVDDGFPCYGWHYEFMVINGYDDDGYLMSGPMDNAPKDWRKFGTDAVGFLEIWSIKPGQRADDKTTIKDALAFAVSFNEQAADSSDAGISGYDNWIKGLDSGKADAFGGAYHAAIWAECRRFAVEFLEEANERTGKEYDSLFRPAIEKYRLVSDNLNEVEKLFPYKGATKEEWKQNMDDAKRRRMAVEHLKAAKPAETEGVKLLGKIVEAMETDERVVIEDVDHYGILEPQFECVRVVLNHRGESYSPAYIQGILGAAFRIAGICPCAPTCSSAMETTELISLLGYEFEHLKLYGAGIDPAKEVYNVVSRVKEEIRAERPVIVWHAFTDYEWDVVCGFDEDKKQFLGYGSYRGKDGKLASQDETRMIEDLPIGAIIIGEKTGKFDARSAELSALREAVRHARDRTETHKDGFPDLEGLRSYDRWVEKFKKSDSKWGGGDSYCYYIYRDTHRAASDFLHEIASGYGKAKEELLAAADNFKAEADALDSAEQLIKADPPLENAQRNAELWPILAKARDNYVAAIEHIEKALATKEMQEGSEKETASQQYGFRYDPMKWAESDETIQGALVRTLVLKKPHEGDQERIDEAIDKILAEQKDDGSFGEEGRETAGKICELLEMGYPVDKPEIQRGADNIVQLVREKKTSSKPFDELEEQPMGIGIMRALCLTGRTDLPELHTTLRWYADNVDKWLNRCCPWGQSQTVVALSAGRQVIDMEEGFDKAMNWVADNINGAGCLSYFDPWSFVRLAGIVDHPLSRTIVEKQLTLILRSQYANGWATNQNSLNALRALEKFGMLEDLRQKPPLPLGCEIAKEISIPEGDFWGLAWDGEKWWMCDDETQSAIAISPEDGKIMKKVKLPEGNGRGFGWWDGAIAMNQGSPWEKDPKRLVKVDPDTGEILKEISLDMLTHAGGVTQVKGNVWVVDSFFGWLMAFDASGEQVRSNVRLAGPLPVAIASDNGDLWHDDLWVPFFIKSGLDHDGQYLDCIEKPFREPFAPKPYGGVTRGMGYDGENLWVLDNSNKRIVMIKKRGE